jgi:hypothetical protein
MRAPPALPQYRLLPPLLLPLLDPLLLLDDCWAGGVIRFQSMYRPSMATSITAKSFTIEYNR